jgi:hypothetical protein
MSAEISADTSEPHLTITLTVRSWETIIAHLRAGIYDNVADILTNIGLQATPQMEDAQLQERAREEREALASLKSIQTPPKDERSVH